jgi:hypothetical protein
VKLGEVGSGGSKTGAVKRLYEYKYEISHSMNVEKKNMLRKCVNTNI